MLQRRLFLLSLGSLLPVYSRAGESAQEPFDPAAWLKERGQGRLSSVTPQSNRPLERFQSNSWTDWTAERKLYERALWELLGPWPAARPDLRPRVLAEKAFPKWTRFKVAYQSLPSSSTRASTITAWLFVPKHSAGKLPALITLHQTLPQGKDEPAGIQSSVPWMAMAAEYADRGYVTLAPDSIGYGERTTGGYAASGFELADAAPILTAHPSLSLLSLMLYDVSRAIDFLTARVEVDPSRVGVIGHSLGGILVNFVLGLEPRLKVGVASCGYGLFRKDDQFPERWAGRNSAYLPRLHLYQKDPDALPLDFLQILALAAPKPQLVQTARGDSIWSVAAVSEDTFLATELRRLRGLHSGAAERDYVHIQVAGGAKDRDHGWYPEGQQAAAKLLEQVLQRGSG